MTSFTSQSVASIGFFAHESIEQSGLAYIVGGRQQKGEKQEQAHTTLLSRLVAFGG